MCLVYYCSLKSVIGQQLYYTGGMVQSAPLYPSVQLHM